MTTNMKEISQKRYELRTARLVRLLELDAPALIVARELFLIIECLDVLNPEEMDSIRRQERHVYLAARTNCCFQCGKYLQHEEYASSNMQLRAVCASCQEKEEQMLKEWDAEEENTH